MRRGVGMMIQLVHPQIAIAVTRQLRQQIDVGDLLGVAKSAQRGDDGRVGMVGEMDQLGKDEQLKARAIGLHLVA